MSNFKIETQEKLNWCWAAVSATVSQYFYPEILLTQVRIANQLMGSENCGQGEACDKAEALQDGLDAAETLLKNPLICEVIQQTIPFDEVRNQIDAGKPVCARMLWGDDVSSHFVIISGYAIASSGEFWLDIKDPYFVDSTVPYSVFVNSYWSSGRWVETYLVNKSKGVTVKAESRSTSDQRANVFTTGLQELVQLKRIPAGLQIQGDPEPVYTASAKDLTAGLPLPDAAKLVSYRYSAGDGSSTLVTGEVSASFPFVLTSLHYGKVDTTLQAVRKTILNITAVSQGEAQVRILRIPGALVEGYWLQPISGGDGSFLRLGSDFIEGDRPDRRFPVPIGEVLNSLQPVEPINGNARKPAQ